MRSYDGSMAWDRVEAALRRDGYALRFSCASFDRTPDDLAYTGREDGWAMRRLLKEWCARNGVTDYRIVRNTSYHRDLHGNAVYELWGRKPEHDRGGKR